MSNLINWFVEGIDGVLVILVSVTFILLALRSNAGLPGNVSIGAHRCFALNACARVRKLRQKIESDPTRSQIITTEMGVGYRLVQRDSSAVKPKCELCE